MCPEFLEWSPLMFLWKHPEIAQKSLVKSRDDWKLTLENVNPWITEWELLRLKWAMEFTLSPSTRTWWFHEPMMCCRRHSEVAGSQIHCHHHHNWPHYHHFCLPTLPAAASNVHIKITSHIGWIECVLILFNDFYSRGNNNLFTLEYILILYMNLPSVFDMFYLWY